MMFSITIFILFSTCVSFAKDLPSYLPRCYLDDSKLNECVLRAFNEIRPHVSNGIEEIGLPPLNPLLVPKLTVKQDTEFANYTVAVNNYTIEGLDNYDIKEFQYDQETMTYRLRIEFNAIPMFALIEVSGHVINVPLIGKGLFRDVFGPVVAVLKIKGNMRKSRGVDYYNPQDANVQLDIADGSYYLEGLFDNNEVMGRMTNEVLNANSVMVAKALTPMFEKLAETGVMRFMKSVSKIPYNELFPSSH